VGADELPIYAMTVGEYDMSTLVHEFTHDMDKRWQNDANTHMAFDRKAVCSPNLMDFQLAGSPFQYNGANGAQNKKDFVSGYAAGLNNAGQDYRQWEDAAESITAYMLLPEYFRSLAAASTVAKAKYDYIKSNLFGGKEFENPDFAGRTSFPWLVNTTGDLSAYNLDRFDIQDIRVLGAAKAYTVTFPAGKSQVVLDFMPLNETLAEAAETATLNIESSSTYQALVPRTATITITNDD
jgi:hypothetical protein